MSGELQGSHENEQPNGSNIYTSLSLDGLLLIAETADSLATLERIDEALAYHTLDQADQQVRDIRDLLNHKMVEFAERNKRETDSIQDMEAQFHESRP